MDKLKSDSRGIAHLILPLSLIVIVVIGAIGWYVYSHRKTSTSSGSIAVVNSETEKACMSLYNDKDLCKFAGNYNPSASYTATFANTDKDGAQSSMAIEADGKGNTSTVVSNGGKETAAFVTLDGDMYMKNETTDTWTKYPKSPTTAETAIPTSDLKIDFKNEAGKAEAQRISYKKIGTEACGSSSCWKYQVIDPSQPGTTSYIWIGTNDAQLHQWSFTDAEGNKSVGTFNYTKVTIKAPSPVKEAAAVPSAAELQQAVEQASQAQ
jgi:hypothetical protein